MTDGTRRFIVFCVIILCALPVVFFSIDYLKSTTTYAGDRTETRDCRWCHGSGQQANTSRGQREPGGRCTPCRGSGRVKVVLPGPNHPSRVEGQVLDTTEAHPNSTYRRSKSVSMFQPIRGAVGGAPVLFTSSGGEVVELMTTSQGKFTAILPPETYQVRITAPGYQTYSEELRVKVLKDPIWLETPDPSHEQEKQANIEYPIGLRPQKTGRHH